MQPATSKGLITIAIGKKYATPAKYLAYSCMLHAPHIIRAVITDQHEKLSPWYDFIIPYNPQYGDPFETKTRLHLYSPFEQSLFLDADSLLVSNPDSYWEALRSKSFAYCGDIIHEGEWYVDIAALIQKLRLPWIPQFNTGMFLFDNSEKTHGIFDTAFEYMRKDLQVPFFRGTMLSDELFLAIGLAKYGETPVNDYGRFSRTLIGAGKIHLDTIKGVAFFRKHGVPVFPLAVHLCGRFGHFLFQRERLKLFFYMNPPLRLLLTAVFSLIRLFWKPSKVSGT